MPPGFDKFGRQALALYRSLSIAKRIMAVGIVGVTTLVLAYLTLADHTEYATLFSGLSAQDAQRIAEKLKKEKTPFRLEAGGSTLRVPVDKVHELRLVMAGAGLPRGGGIGYEIFDEQEFGLSEFAQQVNYRRALQGELERTIREVDVVQSARVHLALPEAQIFARNRKPVTASVTLRLRSGRELGPTAARSIVHLVSSSVVGLSPERISLVETSGRMLWGGGDQLMSSGGIFSFKRNYEESLERRVGELLTRALGPGRAVVRVSADVALAQMEQTDEEYDPDQVAIRSENTTQEEEGSGSKPEGIAGVQGNLPGSTGSKVNGSRGSSERKQITRNYEVNKTTRRRVVPAGEITRLSVAVLVDSAAIASAKAPIVGQKAGLKGTEKSAKTNKKGDEATKKTGRTIDPEAIDLETIREIVSQAVGFSTGRGDVVTVRAAHFVAPQVVADASSWAATRILQQARPWAMPIVFVIFGTVLLIIWLRSRPQNKEGKALAVLDLPKTVRELEGGEHVALSRATQADSGSEGGDDPGERARQLAAAAAEHDALRAAQVIRAWISGG